MLDTPELRSWMGLLDLEYFDLLGLFELLDDGDGQLSLDEFMEAAVRMRGPAKSVDIWRLETKVELFMKKALDNRDPGRCRNSRATTHLTSMFKDAGLSYQTMLLDSRKTPSVDQPGCAPKSTRWTSADPPATMMAERCNAREAAGSSLGEDIMTI
eukprot:gb/GFBE01053252.1/.p1 GENE.gb/GFBE01053252.1/~~gb/GFBE01053252.1/.p1  ORF type:complete len:156 (+),score=30.93 gb/GFBE01053252.1/:1-468(+)